LSFVSNFQTIISSSESSSSTHASETSEIGINYTCASLAFLQSKRKSLFLRPRSNLQVKSLRFYIDNETLIEDVDVSTLRRGDHCLTVLNMMRTLHPKIDLIHSWLGWLGVIRIYHHFIVLDDVSYIDEFGVPRDSDGEVVRILEYANTPQIFLEQVLERNDQQTFLGLLKSICSELMNKAKCQIVPLAEYGDMPHIMKIYSEPKKKKRTKKRKVSVLSMALDFVRDHPMYHCVYSNCEHTTNLLMYGEWKSPQVTFLLFSLIRYIIHTVSIFCPDKLAYHTMTTVPVFIECAHGFFQQFSKLKRVRHQCKVKLKEEAKLHLMIVPLVTLTVFETIWYIEDLNTVVRLMLIWKTYFIVDLLFTLVFIK
jgi:hypothetical protein